MHGFALGGGCELAFHCDIIIAGENARFGLPEVRLGIMPGAGGTQRLLRAAGHFKASRYLLTGDHIPAAVASEMGLVSEVVADAEVMPQALKIASRIAANPPLSVDAIKEVIRLGADASLETALVLERKAFQLLFATDDRNEGIAAFLEKRQTELQGTLRMTAVTTLGVVGSGAMGAGIAQTGAVGGAEGRALRPEPRRAGEGGRRHPGPARPPGGEGPASGRLRGGRQRPPDARREPGRLRPSRGGGRGHRRAAGAQSRPCSSSWRR